jgi:Na+-translocating ferredoxin:NAD+ oxidoreductase subunit C
MSNTESERTPPTTGLTSLPRLDDLRQTEDGSYDADAVREAFDSFRRHALQLQAQLRVLQAAGKTGSVEATGHAVRMDALHLIRAAAEFADALERDAQNASAAQLQRTEGEVTSRQHELQQRERDVERYREESERQRTEILNAAKAEARELLANANRDATTELREAEAKGTRLLEQARHSATELTNATRAEVEQTLEWARAQAGVILARAQTGAEQLLTAAGLGPEALAEVSNAILAAAQASTDVSRSKSGGGLPPAPQPEPTEPRIAAVPKAAEPEPEDAAAKPESPDAVSEPAAEEASDEDASEGADVAPPPVSPPRVSGRPAPAEPPTSSEQGEDAS